MNETADGRWRAAGFVALAVVCLGSATGYVLFSKARVDQFTQAAALLPAAPAETVASVAARPRVLFRNTPTAAEAGDVAPAPVEAPNGSRQITRYSCRWVAMAPARLTCRNRRSFSGVSPVEERQYGGQAAGVATGVRFPAYRR